MTWVREGAAAAPVWRGVDSIFSIFHKELALRYDARMLGYVLGIPAGLVAGPVLCAVALFHPLATWGEFWVLCLASIVFAGVAFLLILAAREEIGRPDHFLCSDWSLTVVAGALVYRTTYLETPRNPRGKWCDDSAWKVSLDEVARVESGLTRDWDPARNYPGQPLDKSLRPVPAHEYQTFLILADSSRRVIYTVNSDREASATLAHSIRSWLEARRAAAPALLAVGEGFDV